MSIVTIIDKNGDEKIVEATAGLSVMEILRSNGYDEVTALCGGCCSCATCHVFVDGPTVSILPPMSEDETDLLDSSSHRVHNSRLSCQLVWEDALEGLTVTIAPED